MSPTHVTNGWSLEVVRGRDVGRRLDLTGPAIVLGNAIDGAPGIDLRDQEGASPRRMAARQAMIEARGAGLAIRDLDSPGGTFVNRRRLLAGQSLAIAPGDEIQVGGVLLRVLNPSTAPPPVPASPGPLAEPFPIAGAVAARAWDDFLTLAANRWVDLRDELTSGRLESYLRRIGRPDLLPSRQIGDPDERLDDWLGRIPASRSSAPELDVHPEILEVPPAAGTTRHLLRITNVGYRRLRTSARVEPPGIAWVRLDGRPILTIDRSELAVEIDRPETTSVRAEIVLESNGGMRRIPIRLRQPEKPPTIPDSLPAPAAWPRRLARMRPSRRIGWAVAIGLAIRGIVLASGPELSALAAMLATLAAVAGLIAGWRRTRNVADAAAAGVASAMAGVLLAAVVHAATRSVDLGLGSWASSAIASMLAWAILGASVAGLSSLILPSREEASP